MVSVLIMNFWGGADLYLFLALWQAKEFINLTAKEIKQALHDA